MILYINSCVRPESRTDRIARALLETLEGECIEVKLSQAGLEPHSAQSLARRDQLIAEEQWDDPSFQWAVQFAQADTIVISAPFWDYSFPALLKTYLENIYVTGLVSRYSPEGIPVGLCRAQKLYYVTTAGGAFVPDFSYNYVAGLAKQCFGIPETELIKAENLDIWGNDPEKIVLETIRNIKRGKST